MQVDAPTQVFWSSHLAASRRRAWLRVTATVATRSRRVWSGYLATISSISGQGVSVQILATASNTVSGKRADVLGLPRLPVQALDLVREDHACDRVGLWNFHLIGYPLRALVTGHTSASPILPL